MSDIVRVLRVIEYVGPREDVERTVNDSIHGSRLIGGLVIRAATIGTYPEILDAAEVIERMTKGEKKK